MSDLFSVRRREESIGSAGMVVSTTAQANALHEVSRDAEHRRRSEFHRPYAMLNKSRPDSRGNFQYYVDSTASEPFVRCNPTSSSPEMPGYCLHPLRDDVPLVDPCSGFMSPGADADMRPVTAKTIPCLADLSDVKPQEADPWEQSSHNMRCKTAPPAGKVPQGPLQKPIPWAQEESDLHHLIHKAGTRWNSVSRSDAALRAALGGWTSKVKANPQVTHGPGTSLTQTFQLQAGEENVRDFLLSQTTPLNAPEGELHCEVLSVLSCFCYIIIKGAYEDVSWDTKLPAKIKPPETTIEKMPDPISHHFTLKRYASQPEVWQVAGGMWDRFQTRMFQGYKKPLAFISPYPRMDHIPGYCGFIGSTNSEDIDNPNSSFIPFTKMRTVQPQYTNTAHTPNIPEYTGRVHWIAIHPAHSNVPSYLPSSDTKVNRSFPGSRIGTAFKHQGPLSRMVTVSPCNPFNKVEKENVQ